MKYESCESKVANLLAAIDEANVPSEKIRLLVECVAEQEKEVQELKKQYLVLAEAHNELVDWCGNHMSLNHDSPSCYEQIQEMSVVVPEETK